MSTTAKVGHPRIRHRPDRRKPYMVVVAVAGKDRSVGSYPTKRAAERQQARLLAAVDAGELFDVASGQPASWGTATGMTVVDACKLVVDERWAGWRAKSRMSALGGQAHVVALSTPDQVGSRADVYRVAYVGLTPGREQKTPADTNLWRRVCQVSPPVTTLTGAVLADVVTGLGSNADGSTASPASVGPRRSALSQVLTAGFGKAGQPVPTLPARHRVTKTKKNEAVSVGSIGTVGEVTAVVDQLEQVAHKRLVWLMLYAGLRPSEARALTWDCVDLDSKVLNLSAAAPEAGKQYTDSGQVCDVQGLKHRANGATRWVPVVPALAAMLADWHAVDEEPQAGPVAVTDGRRVGGSALTHDWQQARQAAGTGWPARKLRRCYDLRHTHASVGLNAGVPVPEMAARLGHDPAELLRTYASVIRTDRDKWTGTLGDALG